MLEFMELMKREGHLLDVLKDVSDIAENKK